MTRRHPARCCLHLVLLACITYAAAGNALGQGPNLKNHSPHGNRTLVLKGKWSWKTRPDPLPNNFVRCTEGGAAVFRISFSESAHEGLFLAKGEAILRDGLYATDADAVMEVQGYYVVDISQLVMVADPLVPVTVTALDNATNVGLDSVLYTAPLRRFVVAQNKSTDVVDEMISARSVLGSETAALPLEYECQFAMKLEVTQLDETIESSSILLAPFNGKLEIHGALHASICGLALDIDVAPADVVTFQMRAFRYSAMATFVALMQVALTLKQLEGLQGGMIAHVSVLTVGHLAGMDAFLCLIHLTLGVMVQPLFSTFATVSFVEFCLFGIFELRLLLFSWRARMSGRDSWPMQASMLYARFYGALLIGILLVYHLQQHYIVLLLASHLFWIPQIVHSARMNVRPPLTTVYILGTSILRLVVPLYIFACPSNLLRLKPMYEVCAALVGLVGLQALVLLQQRGPWGPQWVVPQYFLPAKYDYFRTEQRNGKGDLESGEDMGDCPICMNAIQLARGTGVMTTPCDHRFHRRCLERWMVVKMECPTCRRPLPPP